MKALFVKYKFEIGAFFVFSFLTLVFTFPLVLNLDNSLYGYTSDNFSAAWYFWWLKYAHNLSLDISFVNIIGYPFGVQYGALVLEDSWISLAKLLTSIFNENVALNILFLVSFPVAGLATYQISYLLWKNRLAAFWAGIVFSFAPYHFWQGYSHVSLAFIHTIPLYLYALIYFDKSKSFKAVVFLALSFFFTLTTTFYYGFFMAILTIIYFLVRILTGYTKKENYLTWSRVKLMLAALIMVIVLAVPTFLNFYHSNNRATSQVVSSTGTRTLDDFLSLSLRPWDLFLPAPDHPLWGAKSQEIYKAITNLSADYKTKSAFLPERVIYIGFTVTGFFILSLFLAIKKKPRNTEVIFFTLVLVLITAFALPPVIAIKGIEIYFPSYLLYELTPNLRALVRLGVVILLLASLIGSFSLAYLLRRIKSPARKWFLFFAAIGLVILEFLPLPPSKITSFENPPEYYRFIKDLPQDQVIAEYPQKFDMADALIWQRFHQKRLFNTFNGEYLQLWNYTGDLSLPLHGDLLGALGIDYVLFHTAYLYPWKHPFDELYYTRFGKIPTLIKKDGQEKNVREFPWLKLEREFNGANLYKVAATSSIVISYNPVRKPSWEYPNGHSWTLDKTHNFLYLFNFSNYTEEVILTYDSANNSQISKVQYDDQTVNDINGSILKIKPGLNLVTMTLDCNECKILLENVTVDKIKDLTPKQ